MASKANASLGVIEKFKGENSDLEYYLDELRHLVYAAIDDLQLACEEKLKTYREMSEEAGALIGKAGQLRSKAENTAAFIASQYNKIEQMQMRLSNMTGITATIDNALNGIKNVSKCLQSAINAINAYLSVRPKG